MRIRRVDKINSPGVFCAVFLFFALYYSISEAALETSVFSNAKNESDYYASIVFSEKDWEFAQKFREDLLSMGERRTVVPGTLFYKYKPVKTESFTINSFGYRGDEVKPKEKDEFRIVLFGDSRIFGILLADENTIPAALEKNLRETFPDKNIKVLNFGVEGLTLQRTADAAKHYYKELEPDLVLLYSGANDINEAYIVGWKEWEPFAENSPLLPAFGDKPDDQLSSKIKLLNTMRLTLINDFSAFYQEFNKNDFASVEMSPEKLEKSDVFIKKFTEKVEDTCLYFEERGVNAAYVLSPVAQLNKPLSEIERHLLFRHESFSNGLNLFTQRCEEKISEILAAKRNFKVIDQSRVFDGIKETVYYDGVHFTPEGSRLHAKKLSEELVAIIKEIQNKDAKKN
ncbi:SGNH/GDSL hydrolase family protein [bacterium]|nr:SGNH/GDSL hydrolase family protein [bacterium]